MRSYYKEKNPDLKYQIMSVQDLKFQAGEFDVVIDKACLDAIFCGENSGPNSAGALGQIYKVLKPDGVYICVSYGRPEKRSARIMDPELELNWRCEVHRTTKPYVATQEALRDGNAEDPKNFHYIYVAKKQG